MKTKNIRLSRSITNAIQSVEAAIACIMNGDVVLTQIHIRAQGIKPLGYQPVGGNYDEDSRKRLSLRWVKLDCGFVVDYGEKTPPDLFLKPHRAVAWAHLMNQGLRDDAPWVPSGGVYAKIDGKSPVHVRFGCMVHNPPFRTWPSVHPAKEDEQGNCTLELDYSPLS